MKLRISFAAIIALIAIGAVGAQATTLYGVRSKQPVKTLPVHAKKKQAMFFCAGMVHTTTYCAVSWHRGQISHMRDKLQQERAVKLMKPLKLRPISFSLPRLKKSLRWHLKLLRQAKRAPKPSLYKQAAYYSVTVLHYPAQQWQCLAQIPQYEGGWREVGVQFGHRHLQLREALRYPFGPWQANPGQKIERYGKVLDIRAQVRWVIAYAKRYGGGCPALAFRLKNAYW